MRKCQFEIMDVTLRDGSYAVNYQFSLDDEKRICSALESLGYRYIEIGHGMGLGASNAKNGIAMHSDKEYLQCASECLTNAKYGMFCIPGIATLDDILLAAEYGCSFIRIGTNVEDVKKSESYIKYAKQLNLLVTANYMKSYAVTADEFKKAVQYSESWGADLVYIVDSAGGMLPADVEKYFNAVRQCSDIKVGFHGHDNIGMALTNSLFAIQLGVDFIDCSLQGIGRSAGNTSLEYLTICLKKMGYDIPVDIINLLYVSKKYVYPFVKKTGVHPIDLVCGMAGFHSGYLKDVYKSAVTYEVDPLKLIEGYCRKDQVGLDSKLLNEIAKSLPKDMESLNAIDFINYFKLDNM